jgi:hypothetical protein
LFSWGKFISFFSTSLLFLRTRSIPIKLNWDYLTLTTNTSRPQLSYIDDNLIPKDIPTFAKSLFAKQTLGGFALAPCTTEAPKANATQPTTSNEGDKRKTNGKEQPAGQKKPRKEFLDKSLKMGIFHVKKGTPAAKAFLDKTLLKDSTGICLGFCSQEKKCNFPHQLCKNGKHHTNWKNVPNEDKLVLLKHMDSTGLMWLDAATFEKHKTAIPHEYAHLLGDAPVPNRKVHNYCKALVLDPKMNHLGFLLRFFLEGNLSICIFLATLTG